MSISDIINSSASQFGVSSSFLNTLSQIESGGNPNANNGVAFGLFQFTQSTGAQYGITDFFDPQQSANAAAQLARNNYNSLSTVLGQAPADWQLYLAHQQGLGGATALFGADPNQSAAQALADYGVSPSVAVKSITGNLGSDFQGNKNTATVGQFLSYWENKWAAKSGQPSNTASAVGATTATGAGSSRSINIGPSSGSWAATTVDTPSAASPSNTSSSWTDFAGHWIVRILVFLLGLIFVAAGLFAFSRTGKLTLETAQDNAAGRLAGAISPPRVNQIDIVKAPKAPRAIIRTAKARRKKSPSDDVGLGLGPLGKQASNDNEFLEGRERRKAHRKREL
jgi:hypothetical protein